MEFTIKTKEKQELVNITERVEKIVRGSKVKNGTVLIFAPHSTASIIIIESWDPNICLDFIDGLSKLVPPNKWRHDKIDNNGAAHIKAAIIGPSQSLIIDNGNIVLGQFQSIMLADFDGPRERKVIVKVIKS